MHGRSLHLSSRSSFVAVAVIVSTVAVALAIVAAPAAHAANSQVVHFKFSGTDSDNDFCGTGKTIDLSFEGVVTLFLAPKQPIDFRNQSEGDTVLTNPSNGASVIIHSAYQFSTTLVSGDPSGLHTFEWVFKGGAEIIREAGGGVLSRDAGDLVVDVTFNGDDFVSAQIVGDHGPHPNFGNDCNVLVPALGLG